MESETLVPAGAANLKMASVLTSADSVAAVVAEEVDDDDESEVSLLSPTCALISATSHFDQTVPSESTAMSLRTTTLEVAICRSDAMSFCSAARTEEFCCCKMESVCEGVNPLATKTTE